jgi:hypothetical protein
MKFFFTPSFFPFCFLPHLAFVKYTPSTATMIIFTVCESSEISP